MPLACSQRTAGMRTRLAHVPSTGHATARGSAVTGRAPARRRAREEVIEGIV